MVNQDTHIEYVKFIVTAWKGGAIGSQIPVTGMDLAIKLAREQLEEGQAVEITPFTRKEWASGNDATS